MLYYFKFWSYLPLFSCLNLLEVCSKKTVLNLFIELNAFFTVDLCIPGFIFIVFHFLQAFNRLFCKLMR